MAPALIETPQDSSAEKVYVKTEIQDGYKEAFAQGPKTTNWDNELKGVGKHPPAKYPHYLPVWDNEKDLPNQKYPPNQPFEAYEHGKDADPSFQNLLKGATSVEDLTANIGAEVKGIQLSKLDKAGKDELALFVAQKKVVGKHCRSISCMYSRTHEVNQLSVIKTLQTYQSKKPRTLPSTSVPHTFTLPLAHQRASLRSTWSTDPQQTQPPKITSRSAPTA